MVSQEASKELGNTRFGDLGEQVRELGERGVPLRQSLQRALDAKGHFLESIEGETGKCLARGVPHFWLIATEDIDEEIDYAGPLHLAEQACNAHEAQGRFVLVVQSEGFACGSLEKQLDARAIGIDEVVVSVARGALRVEERRQRRGEVIARHLTTDSRHEGALQPG